MERFENVEGSHFLAGFNQYFRTVATDEAGSTGYENIYQVVFRVDWVCVLTALSAGILRFISCKSWFN